MKRSPPSLLSISKSLFQKLPSPSSSSTRSSLSAYLKKQPTLITKSHLEQSDLHKLFTHQITALQIKAFHPPAHARDLGERLSSLASNSNVHGTSTCTMDNWRVGTERGLEVSDVWTMGEYVPYNVAVATGETEEYFEGVKRDFRRRRLFGNDDDDDNDNGDGDGDDSNVRLSLWPLDQLRLELDEVWQDGAGLARDDHKRVQGGGLPRIMMGPTRWKRGFIHADQYAPLSMNEGLFSGNIYLKLPNRDQESEGYGADDGSELHVWDLEIFSHMDWSMHQDLLKGLTMQNAAMQMKLRKELGEPLKIHVEPGDLVLLCVQKPHAAVGFSEGMRVSLQCFLQYRVDQRLLIDI